MESYELFYDFKFGLANAGYYSVVSRVGHIVMMAKFEVDRHAIENHYELKHIAYNVTDFKYGDGQWKSIKEYGEGHYPTSAYPLLLPRVNNSFTYTAIDDSTGEIEGERRLERVEDVITESFEGGVKRIFRMKEDIPIEIDWGGPISTLQENLEKAKAGSPFA